MAITSGLAETSLDVRVGLLVNEKMVRSLNPFQQKLDTIAQAKGLNLDVYRFNDQLPLTL